MAANKLAKRDRVSPTIINMGPQFDPLLQIADERSEDAVIGVVLQQPDLFPALSEILQPADFFFLLKGYVWHACDVLTGQGKGLDILTVASKMEELNSPIKGEELIRELARMIGTAPDTRNAEQYARQVFESSLRLRVLSAKEEIAQLAVDKTISVDSLVDQCDHLLYKATNRHAENRSDAHSIMSKYFQKVDDMLQSGAISGLPTGFKILDDLTGGLFPGEVAVLAGGEGMGKTTWGLSNVRNVVKAGKRAAVFTLEMSQEEIIRIFTSMETGIYKSVLKQFTLSDYQWKLFTKAAGDISNWPLEIVDDFPTLTPVQLRRKLRTLTQKADMDLVVIDGLWLMEASEPTKNDRPRDVFTIMRDLNQIARDFDVPILITHQYNADINGKKYPTIYQLSESAGVRRNAQVVWGLHRPSYYDRDNVDDATKLYILKDRNGVNVGADVPFLYNKDNSSYEGGKYVTVGIE
jgi:replicative DNA helicase